MPGDDGARATPAVAAPCVVWVGFEPMCEPTLGLWCERCALPAGLALTGLVTMNGRPAGLRTFEVCTNHAGALDG